jgi:hypothetical protein
MNTDKIVLCVDEEEANLLIQARLNTLQEMITLSLDIVNYYEHEKVAEELDAIATLAMRIKILGDDIVRQTKETAQ